MIAPPPGRTCQDVLYDPSPAPATFAMRLCNFPTGHSQILPTHDDAIVDRLMGAMWPYERSWIDVVGFASRLQYAHNPSGNLILSRARCAAVVDRLKELLVGIGPFRLNVIDGRGDSESQHDSYIDHGFHRAVEIRLFSQGQYHWKPKPVLRHGYAVVASDRFEFQAIESASASFSLFEADTMFFSIHDLTNRAIRYFSYRGVGATVPIPKTPVIGASAEHKSPAVPFRTLIKILDMKDFEGTASIEGNPGITAGKISVGGRVSMRLTPKAYEDRSIHNPLVINFSFSRGFGANIKNVGLGSVKMLSSSYRPTVYPY